MSETYELTEPVITQIGSALGIMPTSLKFLGYSQNFVYSFYDKFGVERILRITSNFHRTRTQIESEIEWLDYLRGNGADVCCSIPIKDGEPFGSISLKDDVLHYVIFEKASGKPITSDDVNQDLYFSHGALTGKLHRLAKSFRHSQTFRRFDWDKNRLFTSDPIMYLPDETREGILDMISILLAEVNTIKREQNTYGLIHFDLNYGNFFYRWNTFDGL